MLVLAGPGAGKTRVLAARAAFLRESGVEPGRILATTFSNCAARELQERLERAGAGGWRASTLHALALRVLKAEEARTPAAGPAVRVASAQTLRGVVRGLLLEADLDPRQHPVGDVLREISRARVARSLGHATGARGVAADLLSAYEARLERGGLVDFDDLLTRAVALLGVDGDPRTRWRGRFDHVLVDEAQDLTPLQWRLVEALAGPDAAALFVVGDPDQSIYGWRGAAPDTLSDLARAAPDAELHLLPSNHRSTGAIVECAASLIGYDPGHLPRELESTREEGEDLMVLASEDPAKEARAVATLAGGLHEDGLPWEEIAVLVRTGAQLRPLEQTLRRANIPYRSRGAAGFHDRQEIGDVLAYLRLLDNHQDEEAFWRAIVAPRRGVGDITRRRLQDLVDEINEGVFWKERVTLVRAARSRRTRERFPGVAGRGLERFAAFFGDLEDLLSSTRNDGVGPLVEGVIEALLTTDWLDSLPAAGEGWSPREALDELVQHAREYDERRPDDGLAGFLAETALAAIDDTSSGTDGISLLTMHAAKGTEFSAVFVCGLEEGLVPHARTLSTEDELDPLEDSGAHEERRLLYVAMTRARDRLHLSWCKRRALAGDFQDRRPSRFFAELPADRLHQLDPDQLDVLASFDVGAERSGLHTGDEVEHPHYGRGRIGAFAVRAGDTLVYVDFDRYGLRELFLRHTTLRRPSKS